MMAITTNNSINVKPQSAGPRFLIIIPSRRIPQKRVGVVES
jgi:hypothetical protein